MLSGHTSSTSDELERLRQQYEKLCDLMTRTAETDPAAAERILSELQGVSEKLLVLETAGPMDTPQAPAAAIGEAAEAPEMTAPMERAPAPAAAAPPPAAPPPLAAPSPDPAPAPAPADIPPQSFRIDEPAAPPPAGGAPRIVAFRVTSTATPRPAARQAAPDNAVPASPTPPAADSPKADAAAPAPVPAESGPSPEPLPPTEPAPSAEPGPSPEPSQPAAPAEDPTRFSAAIRQWLERQRSAAEPKPGNSPAEAPVRRRPAQRETSPHAAAAAVAAPVAAPAPPPSDELGRIAAAIEQQALQIERILEMCQTHQAALERLEAQIAARFAAAPSLPAAEPAPELSELRGAVEEQRQRVTALAKTIHNLAQWLAAQRARPER